MKKKTNTREPLDASLRSDIPTLDIIDLDSDENRSFGTIPPLEGSDSHKGSSEEEFFSEEDEDWEDFSENDEEFDDAKNASGRMDKLYNLISRVNLHIVLLVVAVIFICGIIHKISNWGVHVDQNDIFSDGLGSYDNTFDMMLPLINQEGDPVYLDYGKDSNILIFGNAPFADNRDSEDNLANIIQQKTGATVYNCSVKDSYLAALSPDLNLAGYPMDIFNFYWLCTLAMNDAMDYKYLEVVEAMGDAAPDEAMYIYDTLNSIDFNEIDIITIMYDGSDYLAGHGMYNDQNFTDIVTFTGNLAAGISLIQDSYPNIRFIVMSPTYAYGLDEDGNYVSSDVQLYGQHFLSTYVIKQSEACSIMSVTFVDHLYGTVTEANASEYLTDHVHLNVSGRKAVADRFLNALNYYKDK